MTMTFHKEYPADQAAMQAMRAELRGLPTMEFGPEVRPIFDELMANTPVANGVSYEASTVGGVPGWWCRPADAVEGSAVLYLQRRVRHWLNCCLSELRGTDCSESPGGNFYCGFPACT